MIVVGPPYEKPVVMPLLNASSGGPLARSGVMPTPSWEAAGSFAAGWSCSVLDRWTVICASLSTVGENVRVYARLPKYSRNRVMSRYPGTFAPMVKGFNCGLLFQP